MKLKQPIARSGLSLKSVLQSGVALIATFFTLQVSAQTAAINPQTLNYWAGINTTNVLGVGSNSVVLTNPDTSVFNLSVSGQPAGLTAALTTNYCTNSLQFGLYLTNVDVAAGAYSLSLGGSGGSYPSYSTNINFFVVPQWIQTNGSSIGNWSDSTKWGGGVVPSSLGTDSVYFESTMDVPYTNVVDSSHTIQSLVYIADQGSAGPDIVTLINSGSTLSVVGTNGLYFGIKQTAGKRPGFYFLGGGALVVNNASANVAANSGSSSSSVNGPTINMTNLNTFVANVNRFGAGDGGLNTAGLFGGELVNFWLAKTNTITTSFVDNYSNLSFDCAFQFQCNKNLSSGSLNPTFYLGLTNGIYVDSFAVGRAKGTGGVSLSGGGSTLKFASPFSNSVLPVATALFRGPQGGTNRVSLVAVGVDSGAPGTTLANTIGTIDLRGGKIDMLADQIWLGHNRTNATANTAAGAFLFDWGTVNANLVEVGYMQYTNAASVAGYLLVGTNGTLVVNNKIELGHTPLDNAGFPNNLAAATGQLMITNGGTVRANQITVGQYSTNNVITVATGGSLLVSNTIAQPNQSLTTLNLNGGSLTFFVSTGITNAYVTNLNSATTPTKINIAAAPAGQSTNVLIAYQAANQTPNISIGTLPAGFNNMQIVVGATTVSLVVSTNQPKNLAWRGGQNSQWDHSSLNWIDLSLNAPTNITKFTDGDSVRFDDTTAVPTSITIAENVSPGQSGIGILMTNNVNNFIFNNTGAGSIGSCLIVLGGTGNLEVDASTTLGAQINSGTLTVGLTGSIANATTASGTILTNNGTISGGVTCSGSLLNSSSGIIAGSVSILTPSSVVNSGTVSGSISMQTATTLNNSGQLNAIGSTIVPTNSTLINSGTIYGASLTINNGGTLTDTAMLSPGVSAGSINVGTLTVNGAFYPGGTAIGDTKITDYDYATASQLGNPYGRIQLSAGSVTVLQVNSTNTPRNTLVLSQNQGFGPSQAAKAKNGCTLVITNLGPAFYAGQTFQFFGSYYGAGNIGNAGLNTTNSYPIIQPSTPGPGLVWDLSQLIPGGTIGVISAASVQVNLTNNMTVSGTNIVTELSWPSSYTGNGWLQQQITTLDVGLGTNWSNVGSSDYVNDILLTNVITGNSAVFYRFFIP